MALIEVGVGRRSCHALCPTLVARLCQDGAVVVALVGRGEAHVFSAYVRTLAGFCVAMPVSCAALRGGKSSPSDLCMLCFVVD